MLRLSEEGEGAQGRSTGRAWAEEAEEGRRQSTSMAYV
jgi:hypothetical protein